MHDIAHGHRMRLAAGARFVVGPPRDKDDMRVVIAANATFELEERRIIGELNDPLGIGRRTAALLCHVSKVGI